MLVISISERSIEILITILLSGTTLLLMHASGLVDEHSELKRFFNAISEYMPIGLIFLAISEYVVPWLISNVTPFQIIGGTFVLILVVSFTLSFTYIFVVGSEYTKRNTETIGPTLMIIYEITYNNSGNRFSDPC